jgi:hypothetical protein
VWRNLVARGLWVAEVPGSNPGTPTSMADPQAAPRSGGRLKPILLVAAMAFLALNVWTGSPLLAVWIGSRVQGEESQPSMAAYAVVILALAVFSFVLYQLLKLTAAAYRDATGTSPTVRTHAPWLRSMRGERPGSAAASARISGAERIVVVTVIAAALAFEVWFFFFSGSPIGGGGGR